MTLELKLYASVEHDLLSAAFALRAANVLKAICVFAKERPWRSFAAMRRRLRISRAPCENDIHIKLPEIQSQS
jgi:hypothetical protein